MKQLQKRSWYGQRYPNGATLHNLFAVRRKPFESDSHKLQNDMKCVIISFKTNQLRLNIKNNNDNKCIL